MRGRDCAWWGRTERANRRRVREGERATACGLSLHCGLTLLRAHRLAALHGLPVFGKWQVTSTLQGIALGCGGRAGKKKRWIRSRCTVPLGLGRFNFKAQYFSRKSIGVQAVSSMRKTSGSRRRWCPGFSYHPGYEKGISWKRYKAKLNLARGCTNVIITHTLPRTLSCTGITLVPLNRISGQAYDYTQLSEVRLPSWQSYSGA